MYILCNVKKFFYNLPSRAGKAIQKKNTHTQDHFTKT
jgi:hypothetical protein